jgi:hypothetical protein
MLTLKTSHEKPNARALDGGVHNSKPIRTKSVPSADRLREQNQEVSMAIYLRGQLRQALEGIGKLPGQQNQGGGLLVRFCSSLLPFL